MKELGEVAAFILLILFVMAACTPEQLRASYETLTGACEAARPLQTETDQRATGGGNG